MHVQIFLLVATLQLQNGMIACGAKAWPLAHLRRVVEAAYQAAPLNPSWGAREDVTLKLLGAFYHESGFDPNVVNHNANYSNDIGLGQINTIHLGRTFKAFCKQRGLKYRPGLIWNLETNALFAAYINEQQIRNHGRTYVYKNSNRPDQKIIWTYLARVPSFVAALEK